MTVPLPIVGPGFEVDDVPLPAPRAGISEDVRRQLAVIVLRIERGATPEQIASEPPREARRLFDEDELERDEAFAHADILAHVLCGTRTDVIGATDDAITLTRAEAVAVESLLIWTYGDFLINFDASSPSGVEALIRRLRLEAAVREGGGWWGTDSPGVLDTRQRAGEGTCPGTFALPGNAARALAELLPIAFGDTLDDDVETVRALMSRLGVSAAAR